jgi:hypothetical protein
MIGICQFQTMPCQKAIAFVKDVINLLPLMSSPIRTHYLKFTENILQIDVY